MSFKIVKVILTLVIVTVFAFLLNEIIKRINHKEQAQKTIATLLPFAGYQNNQLVAFDTSRINKPYLLLAYFSTDCDHCNYMMEELKDNYSQFTSCNIVVVAEGADTSIQRFAKEHSIDSLHGLTYLRDKDFSIRHQFNITNVPEFFIYNKKGQLVTSIKGETKIENLLKYLQ